MFKLGMCTATLPALEALKRLGIASSDLLDAHREGLLWNHTQGLQSYGDFWCMGEIEKVAYPAD